tara:strand:- start:293 stop:448 length:156 start_codon:yes stop_codon:yes gene_type:complete
MKKDFFPSQSIIYSDGSVITITKDFFIIKTSEGIKYKPREKNKKKIVDKPN